MLATNIIIDIIMPLMTYPGRVANMIFATEVYGDDVFCFSRAKAIQEGELIDVTEAAIKAGFKLPVAVTHAAWSSYIERLEEDEHRQTIKEREARLKDLLLRLYFECRCNPWQSSFLFRLLIIPKGIYSAKPTQIELKAIIGGDENGDAFITVMLPYEC